MRARKTYGNPGRGLGKGSGQTGTDFGDPEGKWGALTGGAELPRLLEVLGKQEAIGVARRQDHTIGGAEESDPVCRTERARAKDPGPPEGLGWRPHPLCPYAPARARGPSINTATSQLSRMPVRTMAAAAQGSWVIKHRHRNAQLLPMQDMQGCWAGERAWGTDRV